MQRNPDYMAEMQEEVANAEYFREVNARERAEVAAAIKKWRNEVPMPQCAELEHLNDTQAATIAGLNAYAEKVEGQRDDLLVELERLADWASSSDYPVARGHNIGKSRALIAQIKAGS